MFCLDAHSLYMVCWRRREEGAELCSLPHHHQVSRSFVVASAVWRSPCLQADHQLVVVVAACTAHAAVLLHVLEVVVKPCWQAVHQLVAILYCGSTRPLLVPELHLCANLIRRGFQLVNPGVSRHLQLVLA